MSVTGNSNSTPLFGELKKHASFFLKEKIKTARLALTDVTQAQLLTEEATSASPWAPDTKTMGIISRAAFELDDYWRIVDILHTRLVRFDKTNWRVCYKALIILEHLLTHGPESVAQEFDTDTDLAIREMESFQYVDERGFNWGLTLRKKSQRVQKLLERGPLLKQERQQARTLSRGIQGFGSFSNSKASSSAVFNHQDVASSTTPTSSLILDLEKYESKESIPPPPLEDSVHIMSDGGKYKSNQAVPLDHPFDHNDQLTTASLLSTGDTDDLF